MKISIIIPIYNMEEYLPECLVSIEKQNFTDDVEVLLIDDGSSDASLKICEEAASRYPHYRVIHQSNQGVASARNTGLTHATGEYIAWIDPDDYITDDWFETIKNELQSSPDMILFDMYSLKNGKLNEIYYFKKSQVLSKIDLCKELMLGIRIGSHLVTKIFRRIFFDQLFPSKYSYCEDYSILHKVCFNVERCKYIHKPIYIYRLRENSIANNFNNKLNNKLTHLKLCKQRYNFYKKKGIEVSKDGMYVNFFIFCLLYCQCNKIDVHFMEKIYNICFVTLCKNFFNILLSKNIPYKSKLRIACFVLMGQKKYESLDRLFERMKCDNDGKDKFEKGVK